MNKVFLSEHKLVAVTLFALVTAFLSIFTGSSGFIADDLETFRTIVFSIRIPRAILGFITGSSLAVSGMVFQTLFRNPMATPYTLGVSSGASLGAAISIIIPSFFFLPDIVSTPIFAFAGALLSIAVIYSIMRIIREFDITILLLAGVAVSFTFSSLIMLAHYTADASQSYRIMHWLMGSLDTYGIKDILRTLPFFILVTAVTFIFSNELDMFGMSEEMAKSKGVDTKKVRFILFLTVSISTGGIVSVTGPIGFVGMMAPHICRLFTGWAHKKRIPITLVFGGGFLMFCDLLARVAAAPAEIPTGIITAITGGPFFIWLLYRLKRLP
ncbi:MAG: iron ABC transporter permease [bacterium]